MSRPPLDRREELACDAALVGLDERERTELDALEVDEVELLALERAAGEFAAASLGIATSDNDAHVDGLSPELAERVLARINLPAIETAEPPYTKTTTGMSERAPEARKSGNWLPWALVAAALVLAVLGWTHTPRVPPQTTTANAPSASSQAPVAAVEVEAGSNAEAERADLLARAGTASFPWKATKDDVARNASGEVVWHHDLQRGVMRFHGLEPNDPKKEQYQLWIFDAERDQAFPVDGGVFDVGPNADVIVPIKAKLHVGKATLFAVTLERSGGVVVSKRDRIVLTAAPPG